MEQQELPIPPIEELLDFIANELDEGIVINGDVTGFWKKSREYVFEVAIPSFREGIQALSEGMAEDKEMYDYFSCMVFRIFAQPFTDKALNQFSTGFDEGAKDAFFKGGFSYLARDMSKVERLLLFITVHRNKIIMASHVREELLERTRIEERAARRGNR